MAYGPDYIRRSRRIDRWCHNSGAGGGGPYSLGKQFVADLKKRMSGGKAVPLVSLEELAGDVKVAIPAGVGQPAAAAQGFPLGAVTSAFTKLAGRLGTAFAAVLPGEIGAGNTLIPLSVALDLGLPVLDASGAGRAMPSLQMSSFAAVGIPVGTVVLSSESTNVVFEAGSAATTDLAMRALMSGGVFDEDAGAALWAMSGQDAKRSAIAGTFAKALDLGRVVLGAPEGAKVEAARSFLGGKVLQVGTPKITEQTSGGFDQVRVTVTSGSTSLVLVGENENLIVWSSEDDSPLLMAPDLACYLGVDGTPYSNGDLAGVTAPIAVMGVPADGLGASAPVIEAYRQLLLQFGYAGAFHPFAST